MLKSLKFSFLTPFMADFFCLNNYRKNVAVVENNFFQQAC